MTVSEYLRAVWASGPSPAGWWFVGFSAVLGGVIGSFLNVVVYRLPRGLSLSHPGSHCPRCGHPIRWRDNIPVLGWVALGGRCRDCGAAISARYPLVEGFVAILFAGFAWLEFAGGGINLPERAPLAGDSAAAIGLVRYAGHMLLVCSLLAAALVERDGRSTPLRLWAPALTLGFAAAIWRPTVRPAPLPPVLDQQWQAAWQVGLVEGVCGLAAGLLLGAVAFAAPSLPRINGQSEPDGPPGDRGTDRRIGRAPSPAPALAALVGVYLGLQAVCWIVAGSVAWRAVSRIVAPAGAARDSRPLAGLFAATVIFLLAWRWLAALEANPGARWLWLAAALAALSARALVARRSPGAEAGPMHRRAP